MRHTEFRAWRRQRGMTQLQAAAYLDLSIATIRAYECNPRRSDKGRRVPRRIVRYIEALHDSEMLRAAPAILRRQVAKHWKERHG